MTFEEWWKQCAADDGALEYRCRTTWNAAMEEAAKICERHTEYLLREVGGKGQSDVEKKQAATSMGLAAAIRFQIRP